MKIKPKLPQSPTSVPINFVAVAILIFTIYIIRRDGEGLSHFQAAIISILSIVVPIILLEFIYLKPSSHASTGLDFKKKQPWNMKRLLVKLFGFYMTLVSVAFVYWLIPEYQGDFYDNYYTFLKLILPWYAILAIPYFIIIDHHMVNPKDGYWNIGLLFLGQWKKIDYQELKQHALGWLVKTFYLALMFTYSVKNTDFIRNYNISEVCDNFANFFHFTYHSFFVIDVYLATGGYLLSLRIFGSHIRSAEPTFLGWFVALECYEPFWSFSSQYYLNYFHEIEWNQWLKFSPVLYTIWGCIILFLVFIYLYATITFGIRFSNLTNRGILTNGPYRFCKHPAYVAKNISWWLISMPFLAQGGTSVAIRKSLLLLGVNLIYFLRARTEERHLSIDPVYVEYANIMNERSIFFWIGKIFPSLQYKKNRLLNTNDK